MMMREQKRAVGDDADIDLDLASLHIFAVGRHLNPTTAFRPHIGLEYGEGTSS